MQELPHYYRVTAAGAESGEVRVAGPGLEELLTAPPAEFGGPGDRWSPEALLVAAVANCFVLTFRAVARASKLPWSALECEVEGVLDRVDRKAQFHAMSVSARLSVPGGVDLQKAERVLEKAEAGCLITNSLKCESRLSFTVLTED
jgi:organic hydroperoxide reductase OsmC/OhrA